jgi:hypothetical protein
MPGPTLYTFQNIMTAIFTGSITNTSDIKILVTREAYSNIITNSNGQLSNIVLPIMAVSTINFDVAYYNYAPYFPFVVSDFITAADWLVYTLPT